MTREGGHRKETNVRGQRCPQPKKQTQHRGQGNYGVRVGEVTGFPRFEMWGWPLAWARAAGVAGRTGGTAQRGRHRAPSRPRHPRPFRQHLVSITLV